MGASGRCPVCGRLLVDEYPCRCGGWKTREWLRQQPQGVVVEARRSGSVADADWTWYVDTWNANFDRGRAFTRMTDAGTLYSPPEQEWP